LVCSSSSDESVACASSLSVDSRTRCFISALHLPDDLRRLFLSSWGVLVVMSSML